MKEVAISSYKREFQLLCICQHQV